MARMPYAFFYGGYMNPDVLRASGTQPMDCEIGYVEGLRLTVGPLANLEESKGSRAYGLLARLSHEDLSRLYGGDPAALQGIVYLPEAVLVHTINGQTIPAMTYICPTLSGGIADAAYVAKLVVAAEKIGLPADYVSHLRDIAVPQR